jgi:predicted transposase YbfD/YdcC
LRDQSCMPVTPADAEAVITEAERITREAAAEREARARRKVRQEERTRKRGAERERKAAEQAERERGRQEEEQRLRAEAEQARKVLLRKAAVLRDAAGGSIRDCFEGLPEPRDPRGLRHPLPAVLTLVVTAMLHGKTRLAAITSWIRHADQETLELAGCRHRGRDGLLAAPSPRTVTRLLGLAGATALACAVSRYLAAGTPAEPPAYPVSGPALQPQVACDGKMTRGALRADGTPLFLLSAAVAGPVSAPAGAVVIADREIPAKTNEIPEMAPMLRELDDYFPLAGHVLTADALHAQDDFAKLAREELGAHFVLTVKKNRKNLHAALEGLCWAGAARHVTEDRGHGRAETRSHLVMDAPEEIRTMIPHVRQVAKVHRVRTARYWKGDGSTWKLVTRTTRETVYLVTSLTAREAGPEHIAAYIRSHWGIENQVHWVRDATLREDDSKVRARNRPRNLATLRNLLTGLCRQLGLDGIAATIREAEYDKHLVTAITRLITAP